jgi:hypothetical protein
VIAYVVAGFDCNFSEPSGIRLGLIFSEPCRIFFRLFKVPCNSGTLNNRYVDKSASHAFFRS